MQLARVASKLSEQSPSSPLEIADDVVEIGILLPANRAADLIQMAKARRESVGHLIRTMIDRELLLTRASG